MAGMEGCFLELYTTELQAQGGGGGGREVGPLALGEVLLFSPPGATFTVGRGLLLYLILLLPLPAVGCLRVCES